MNNKRKKIAHNNSSSRNNKNFVGVLFDFKDSSLDFFKGMRRKLSLDDLEKETHKIMREKISMEQ
jgi:hypothetical protein